MRRSGDSAAGRLGDRLDEARRDLRLDPGDQEARRRCAILLERLGRHVEAERLLAGVDPGDESEDEWRARLRRLACQARFPGVFRGVVSDLRFSASGRLVAWLVGRDGHRRRLCVGDSASQRVLFDLRAPELNLVGWAGETLVFELADGLRRWSEDAVDGEYSPFEPAGRGRSGVSAIALGEARLLTREEGEVRSWPAEQVLGECPPEWDLVDIVEDGLWLVRDTSRATAGFYDPSSGRLTGGAIPARILLAWSRIRPRMVLHSQGRYRIHPADPAAPVIELPFETGEATHFSFARDEDSLRLFHRGVPRRFEPSRGGFSGREAEGIGLEARPALSGSHPPGRSWHPWCDVAAIRRGRGRRGLMLRSADGRQIANLGPLLFLGFSPCGRRLAMARPVGSENVRIELWSAPLPGHS